MDQEKQKQILANPEFREFCRRKTRLGVVLTAIVVVCYMAFQITMPLAPEFLGQRLFGMRVFSIGIVWATALVIGSILITGIYVWFANIKLRQLENSARKALEDEE